MSLLDDEKDLIRVFDINVLKDNMKQGNKDVIVRTIHPVGQGAFYSERYIDKEGITKHLMVYDCGSNSPKKLEREVSSSIKQNEIINILFISHFDRDHVNGLINLKKKAIIEKVVMPLLSPFDKYYFLLDLPSSLQDIILNPQEFFGEETAIIYVNPIIEDSDNNSNNDTIDIDSEFTNTVIESGTQLRYRLSDNWCYIPFNFDGVVRRMALEESFRKNGIIIEELEKGNLSYIIEEQTNIKKAYRSICADGTNASSLILYSGPINATCHCIWFNGEVWNKYFNELKNNAACLYLGDTDLNQTVCKMNLLDCLSVYLENVGGHIGTIQVPHHGSFRNFNHKILTMWNSPKHYFASFGLGNQHGHPSSYVLANIMCWNPFYGVTEARNSIAIEYIYL